MADMTSIGPAASGTMATGAPSNPQSEIRNPKLLKAAREFESYFVGVVLKKMHDSAAKGGLFGDDKAETQTYREMFDDAVAQQIGKRGSFGIADMLYRELGGGNLNAAQRAAAQTAQAAAAADSSQTNGKTDSKTDSKTGKDHEHE